jgi:hypothetical protein
MQVKKALSVFKRGVASMTTYRIRRRRSQKYNIAHRPSHYKCGPLMRLKVWHEARGLLAHQGVRSRIGHVLNAFRQLKKANSGRHSGFVLRQTSGYCSCLRFTALANNHVMYYDTSFDS